MIKLIDILKDVIALEFVSISLIFLSSIKLSKVILFLEGNVNKFKLFIIFGWVLIGSRK